MDDLLFLVVSFVMGCVNQICQSFLSKYVFFHHSFWSCRYGFLIFDLSLPVGDKFFWSDDKWN